MRRKGKKTDQEEIEKAYRILNQTILSHPEIEPTLWCGACWSIMIDGYLNSKISYEDFCSDFDSAKKFYRNKWKEHEMD